MNLKDKIKAANGRKVKTFEVPQWGFPVSIRSWSARELQDFTDWSKDGNNVELFGRVAAMSLCDEQGCLLFADEDIPSLCEKDLNALLLILEQATTFNKVSKDQFEATKNA